MADHPLRSATHLRLGGLLSHQLANAPQAHPIVTLDCAFQVLSMPILLVSGISKPFGMVSQSIGQIAYVLLTRSPLESIATSSLDLHVLGTPPAFILSQDQTLKKFIS